MRAYIYRFTRGGVPRACNKSFPHFERKEGGGGGGGGEGTAPIGGTEKETKKTNR